MAHRRSYVDKYIVSPIREFLDDSRAVGIILICCTVASLAISNSPTSAGYLAFWEKEILNSTTLNLPHTPLHLINDLLMSFFFLLAGMEIKRELMVGELSHIRKSLLPIIAALGGMVVPAIIYAAFCSGTAYSRGWGIPMATDIAFSLGLLSLLGKKAPLSIRILLMALAIIDDLGGIITIAIFYARAINMQYLGISGLLLIVLAAINLLRVQRVYPYMMIGALLWYCVYNSGVHPTIAGVLLAFCMPMKRINHMIHSYHDPVNFIVLPLFAIANTAISLPIDITTIASSAISYGILFGLVLGKPVGIFCFSWLAVKLKIGALPGRMSWKQLLGMSMVAGIGFTISIFMATLAFDDYNTVATAKVVVIAASLLSGIIGFIYLRALSTKKAAGIARR